MAERRNKMERKDAQKTETLNSNKTDSKRTMRVNFKNEAWYKSARLSVSTGGISGMRDRSTQPPTEISPAGSN